MAPIKFEENMRDKLEKRSIQPTPSSWDALVEKLNKDQDNKRSNRFWWIGIAAAVVLMFSVGYTFLNNNDKKIVPVEIVEVEAVDLSRDNEKLTRDEIQSKKLKPEESVVATSSEHIKIKDISNTEVTKKAVQLAEKENVKPNAAETLIVQNESKTMDSEMTAEAIKVKEVVREIKRLQDSKVAVSDKEIDSLLKSAQKELITNKITKDRTRVVSADALLQDVEAELEDSFRDKVFDALRSSYESVRTAVAERNN